jgi:hypothetical protein
MLKAAITLMVFVLEMMLDQSRLRTAFAEKSRIVTGMGLPLNKVVEFSPPLRSRLFGLRRVESLGTQVDDGLHQPLAGILCWCSLLHRFLFFRSFFFSSCFPSDADFVLEMQGRLRR